MAGINGTLYIVDVDGNPIAYQQNATLNFESDALETTNKESGGWREYIYGARGWSIEGDALFISTPAGATRTGLEYLEDAMVNRTTVTVVFIEQNNTSGTFKWTGEALVTSLSREAPVEDVATFSFSLQGTGPLTRAQLP